MEEYNLVDIHLHTNDSFDAYENEGQKSFNIDEIIEDAKEGDHKIKLICKTDHNILGFDNYLSDENKLKKAGIKYLPGIEINGTKAIHWLFIFDDKELMKKKDGKHIGNIFEDDLYDEIYNYNESDNLIEQSKIAQTNQVDIDKFINLIHRYKLAYIAIPHLNKSSGVYKKIKDSGYLEIIIGYLNDNVISGFESKQQARFIIDSINKTQSNIDKLFDDKIVGNELNRRVEHLKKMTKFRNALTRNDISVIYGSDYHGRANTQYKDFKGNLFYMQAKATFEGLKLSLLDQESRIQTVDEYVKNDKSNNYLIKEMVLKIDGREKTIKFSRSE